MLSIKFSSLTLPTDESCSPSETITITPTGVWCGTFQFAAYFSSMWRVGSHFFTAGKIKGPVFVRFRGPGELAAGPFPGIRLVGQYIFDGDDLVARVENEKWLVCADGREYDAAVVSPGPATDR
jgi:hypothetical protein